ncbi:Maf family protein [Parvularcula marina]|uniref:Nucleoside triphosphate pyrophosphatase n=1 Tax=Parvularcula marina TaxID=2292771 RepID=A0A371RIY2_9PROT|nr:Maf family protein [Parvularcula marina]RFB05412.1 septum formation inhibitor Maf [Parvularcula marina]
MSLVLASRSASRRALLDGAGILYDARPADIDEGVVKARELLRGKTPAEIALILAEEKALACAASGDEFVIGADQVMEFDGELYDKPVSLEEAGDRLFEMAGKIHYLRSGLVLAKGGEIIWRHRGSASLTMRKTSRDEIASYLETVGERVLATVGAYKLEGEGVRLFENIEGDYFTILGLPLMPLLAELRAREVLAW